MDKTVGIRLQVGATGLGNISQLSRELQAAGVQTQVLDARAAELDAELKRLNDQQRLIDAFKQQKAAVASASGAMTTAKARAGELAREIAATEEPTARQQRAFDKARQAARDAAQQYDQQRSKLQDLRGAMQATGVSTEGLAAAQVTVRKGITAAADEVQRLAGTYRTMASSTRDAATAGDAAAGAAQRGASAMRSEGAAANEASSRMADMVSQLRSMTAIDLASRLGGQVVGLVKDVGATAEAFANLQARVKLVTGDGAAFQQAMQGIADVSLKTSSNLEDTAKLFTRVAQAGKEIGVGQAEALRLTETINKAVQLGGESADSSRAAVTQLIQGLQSGVLRGEEFNSVMEQAPRLARALADGLGVTVGQLRALAMNGELSSQTVIRALQQQRAVLDKEFATLPATMGRALENLSTKWTLFVGDLSRGAQQAGVMAAGINGLANNLENIAGMAARAGTVLTAALAVEGVAALRALAASSAAGSGAIALLTKNIEQVPKVLNIAVAVVGLEAGYQIGQMLYENSELARKLGVGVAEFFTALVNDLQFVAESAKAVFTDDTVSKAFDRYKQRAEEQRAIYQGLYDDAAKSPEVVRAAAASAADETAKLGTTASAAGSQVAAAGAAGAAGMSATGKAAEDAKGAVAGLLSQMQAVTPALAASARQQADAMVAVALAGSKAADAFRRDLPEAIDKLNGAELGTLRNLLVQSLTDARVKSEQLAAGVAKDSLVQVTELRKAAEAADLLKFSLTEIGKQAAQSLGVDVTAAATTVSAAFQKSLDNLSVLVRSMPQLSAAGIDAASTVGMAISKMIDGAHNTAELDAIADRLKALGQAGILGGDQVADGLKRAADKARELKASVEDATPGVQSLGEAARKAGVEVELLTTGVRKSFSDSQKTVADLVTEIVKTGTEAGRASPVLAEALNKQIEAAKTREEVTAVRREIERAREAGVLFGNDLSQAAEKARVKLAELSPAFQRAAHDAKLLGVELKNAVGDSTEKGVEQGLMAYERLKASGKASAGEIDKAFVNLANQAIESARGQVPEWVKVEAGLRNVTLQTDAAGKAVVSLRDKTKSATDEMIGGISNLSAAWKRENDARNAATKSVFDAGQGRYDAEGFSLNTTGQRVNAGGQLKPPDGWGDLEFVADAAFPESKAIHPSLVVNGVGYWRPKDSAATTSSQASASQASSGSKTVATPAPTAQATGRTITLRFGSDSTSFTVGSDAEAAALESFLSQLQSASQRASGT